MELYGNDFSAEIIHEYYTSLKVKEWFTKGHTEETFKVAVIHYPIGHSDHTDASHLPKKNFVYNLPSYSDERGMFVEMLKTHDSGQFSYFTINLGVTRGAHYHHTKTEKFLTVKGTVRMRFRRLSDGEHFEVVVDSKIPQIVDSIPGWVHDITNIGNDEAIVMLWANEIFDREKPDCVSCEV